MSRPISADELLAILEQSPSLLGLSRPDPALPPIKIPVDLAGRAHSETAPELVRCECGVGDSANGLPRPVRLDRCELRIASEPVDVYLGACRDCGRVYWG